jgi:flagellar biosynthesis anti-sigma factor FlgM
MKIDERVANYLALLNVDAAKPAAKPGDAPGAAAKTGSTSDHVDLSSAATQLSEDEARLERLDAIRRQLATGTYNISGKDVADKMLNLLKG